MRPPVVLPQVRSTRRYVAARGRADVVEDSDPPPSLDDLLAALREARDRALDHYRAADPGSLDDARTVGRAALPSTVRGLLFHAAEHARRHAGQVVATAAIVRGLGMGTGRS
jgi:uncharacterized damage-inducible protein DinB